jgi:hypothetical protein
MKFTPNSNEPNEYLPTGKITIQVPSQTFKTIYIMQKLNEDLEWSDAGETEIEFVTEYMVYKPMVNYSDGYGYAHQYGNYPNVSINPYSNEGKDHVNKGYSKLQEIEEDDDY